MRTSIWDDAGVIGPYPSADQDGRGNTAIPRPDAGSKPTMTIPTPHSKHAHLRHADRAIPLDEAGRRRARQHGAHVDEAHEHADQFRRESHIVGKLQRQNRGRGCRQRREHLNSQRGRQRDEGVRCCDARPRFMSAGARQKA